MEFTKSRKHLVTLQEKVAVLGSKIDDLEKELLEKKSQIQTLEQNMNASNLQCSTLQVISFPPLPPLPTHPYPKSQPEKLFITLETK